MPFIRMFNVQVVCVTHALNLLCARQLLIFSYIFSQVISEMGFSPKDHKKTFEKKWANLTAKYRVSNYVNWFISPLFMLLYGELKLIIANDFPSTVIII
jgi:hypothetical protein